MHWSVSGRALLLVLLFSPHRLVHCAIPFSILPCSLHRPQRLYRSKGEATSKAAAEHLQDVAECIVPRAGMFMWMRFKSERRGGGERLGKGEEGEHRSGGVAG